MPRKQNTLVITSDSTAEYTCVCGATHAIAVDPGLLRSSTPVRMRFRCPCGRRRVFFLERRAAVRKHVDLLATLTRRGNGSPRPVLIRNLSRTGAMLELDGEVLVRVGEQLDLEFELDHAETTRFRKRAVVRRVVDGVVGAEFVGGAYDGAYDIALALHRPRLAPGDAALGV